MTDFIGIVCGLKSEAGALGPLRHHPKIRVAVSGASALRAADRAQDLVREGARGLLSFGVSGGLSARVAPGDLVLATDILWGDERLAGDDGFADALSGGALACGIALHFGPVLGSDRIIGSAGEKARLGQETGALAVDMESHAVAQVAQEAGVPFGALRAVADPVDRVIPDAAHNGVSPDGSVRPWPVLGAALRDPAVFLDLMRVGQDSAAAHKALRRCARNLVPLLLRVVNIG